MTDRPYTTPLFLLRCVQIGLSVNDLQALSMGLVYDMFTEYGNDQDGKWSRIATQKDFDAF